MTRFARVSPRLLLLTLVAMATPALPLRARDDAPPRVAMVDFTSDDTLHRGWRSAATFTTAVQSRLIDAVDVQWVERQQLDLAIAELKLDRFMHARTSVSLRIGRWVKADLLVTGRFVREGASQEKEPGTDSDRVLHLQIVDLSRARSLRGTTIPVHGDARDVVRVDAGSVAAAATWLETALREAAGIMRASRDRRFLAPIFFRNAGQTARLDYLGGDLLDAIEAAAAASDRLEVLRFVKSNEAAAETSLELQGLVEDDRDAWKHVADAYVWGRYKERDEASSDFKQVVVDLTLTVWDGRGAARHITQSGTVGQSGQWLADVARRVCDASGASATGSPAPDVRDRVATVLHQQALDLKKAFTRIVPWDPYHAAEAREAYRTSRLARAIAADLIRHLETAHFFAPERDDIKTELFHARWNGVPRTEPMRFDDYRRRARDGDHLLQNSFTAYLETLYAFLLAINQARWAERFPVDAPDAVVQAWRDSASDRIVACCRRVHDAFRAGDIPPHHFIIHATAAPSALSLVNLLRQVADPLQRVEIIESLWPVRASAYAAQLETDLTFGRFHPRHPSFTELPEFHLEEVIYGAFAEAGNPQRAIELLDVQIEIEPVPGKTARAPRATARPDRKPEPPSSKVRGNAATRPAPRAAVSMRPPATKASAPAGPWDRIVAVQVNARCLDAMPRDWNRFRRSSSPEPLQMGIGGNWLWINDHLGFRGYDPASHDQVLFCDASGRGLVVNAFHCRQDMLYVGVAHRGVWVFDVDQLAFAPLQDRRGRWQIDPESLTTRKISERDGLVSMDVKLMAGHRGRLYFGGHDRHARMALSTLDAEGGALGQVKLPSHRKLSIAACDHWLITRGDEERLQLIDTRSGAARDLLDFLESRLLSTEARRKQGRGNPLGLVGAWAADESGFWLAMRRRLLHLDPATGEILDASMHAFMPKVLADDGDVLWIGGTRTGVSVGAPARRGRPAHILAFHKTRRQWIARFTLPRVPFAMAASPARLWVQYGRERGRRGDPTVWEIARTPVLSTPPASWVAHVPPPDPSEGDLRDAVPIPWVEVVWVSLTDREMLPRVAISLLVVALAATYVIVRRRRRAGARAAREGEDP